MTYAIDSSQTTSQGPTSARKILLPILLPTATPCTRMARTARIHRLTALAVRKYALDPDATTSGHWMFFVGLAMLLIGLIWLTVQLAARLVEALLGLLS